MKIQILNARRNFATNSSSTHSVIMAGSASGHSVGDEYGWGWFLQETKAHKTSYMAAQLFEAIRYQIGDEAAVAVVKGLFGRTVDPEFTSVDHQSRIDCPTNMSGHPLVDFYRELSDALINDDTAHIQGGNDNDDSDRRGESHPRWNFLKSLTENRRLLARKNSNGVWTVFNKDNGLKIHLNFSASVIPQNNYRPDKPELVDLKITDFCPFGCTWCYQDSKPTGKHADYQEIAHLYYEFKHNSIFEVALGGGEPTMHPDFLKIIKGFKREGVIVNFTTKNHKWYKKADFVQTVLENCGGWAHSVTNAHEVRTALEMHSAMLALYEPSYYDRPKMTFQYIPDAYDLSNFREVLEAVPSHYTLTLLGYKEVGRGNKRPFENKRWLEVVMAQKETLNGIPHIAIDTQMANHYEDVLKEHNISDRLYYTQEGRFSMYVDMVQKKYAKSSYAADEQYIPFSHNYEWVDGFSQWNV